VFTGHSCQELHDRLRATLCRDQNAIACVPHVAGQVKLPRKPVHEWPEADALHDPPGLNLPSDDVHASADPGQLLRERHVENARPADLGLHQHHARVLRHHASDRAGVLSLRKPAHCPEHSLRA